jgi:hypothetical protein
MGRRNACSKAAPKAFSSYGSFARADSSGTPPWLGSDGVQPDRSIVLGEVLVDQLTKGCCIDRLSWQRKPDISNNVGPVKHFLSRLLQSLKRVFSSASSAVFLFGLDDYGSLVI